MYRSTPTRAADDLERGFSVTIAPSAYVAALVVVALATYGFKLTTQGIFACPSDGYQEHAYLADCNARAYGDYDHGAFWYQLEGEAVDGARQPDVLFVGNSRMQLGFSTNATEDWFQAQHASVYLLGFSHSESSLFVGPLIERIKPSPMALIVNVDDFFRPRLTPPANAIFAGGDTAIRYAAKRRWQPVHRWLCGRVSWLCGDNYAIFRDKRNGFWSRFGELHGAVPGVIATRSVRDRETWGENQKLALSFLEQFELHDDCVFFTVVPHGDTPLEKARWLSRQLQVPLIEPDVGELHTFDGSHLDRPSAERWSKAFFAAAEGRLNLCLTKAAKG